MPATCPFCAEEVATDAAKCRSCGEWLDPARANGDALACPWCCRSEGDARRGEQRCGGCGRSYALFAGPRLDPAVEPPGGDGATLVSRSAGLILRKQAEVTSIGFSHGNLDPVTGMIPVDARRIAFADVITIATWSRPDWWLLLGVALLGLPVSALLAAGAWSEPVVGIVAAPLWALTAGLLWRAFRPGARFMRVTAPGLTLSFRHDAPVWRWRRFRAEALRRSGIEAGS